MRIKITNPMMVKEVFRDREFEVVGSTHMQYGVNSGNPYLGRVWFHHYEVTVLED